MITKDQIENLRHNAKFRPSEVTYSPEEFFDKPAAVTEPLPLIKSIISA